jgi:hypothetical protein
MESSESRCWWSIRNGKTPELYTFWLTTIYLILLVSRYPSNSMLSSTIQMRSMRRHSGNSGVLEYTTRTSERSPEAVERSHQRLHRQSLHVHAHSCTKVLAYNSLRARIALPSDESVALQPSWKRVVELHPDHHLKRSHIIQRVTHSCIWTHGPTRRHVMHCRVSV